jgi:hypothetical protein
LFEAGTAPMATIEASNMNLSPALTAEQFKAPAEFAGEPEPAPQAAE